MLPFILSILDKKIFEFYITLRTCCLRISVIIYILLTVYGSYFRLPHFLTSYCPLSLSWTLSRVSSRSLWVHFSRPLGDPVPLVHVSLSVSTPQAPPWMGSRPSDPFSVLSLHDLTPVPGPLAWNLPLPPWTRINLQNLFTVRPWRTPPGHLLYTYSLFCLYYRV